ncbi:MAG: hypothetical protein ACFFBD_04360 [Candidatus Hodarchaeota archaeon]
MKRRVLFIPKDEILRHFELNNRQDIKIIVPQILTKRLFNILKEKGKEIKSEQHLSANRWEHSGVNDPNWVCESHEFDSDFLSPPTQGSFTISFANEKAQQDAHYHQQHLEIYFSEHPMSADYRNLKDSEFQSITLEHGGAIIFGSNIVHKMQLNGLTLVIEIPSISNDKIDEPL